jgi:hypothetical protein
MSPFRTLPENQVLTHASTSSDISDAHIKNLRTAAVFASLVEEIKMKFRGGLQWHDRRVSSKQK